MSADAVKNNEKVFPWFRRQLAVADSASYATYTRKFKDWLSNERAYYREARPQIVSLLQVAQQTLRKAINYPTSDGKPFHISRCPPSDHSMVDAYIALLRVVEAHLSRFSEPELYETVKILVNATYPEILPTPTIDLSREEELDLNSMLIPHVPVPEALPSLDKPRDIPSTDIVPTDTTGMVAKSTPLIPSTAALSAPVMEQTTSPQGLRTISKPKQRKKSLARLGQGILEADLADVKKSKAASLAERISAPSQNAQGFSREDAIDLSKDANLSSKRPRSASLLERISQPSQSLLDRVAPPEIKPAEVPPPSAPQTQPPPSLHDPQTTAPAVKPFTAETPITASSNADSLPCTSPGPVIASPSQPCKPAASTLHPHTAYDINPDPEPSQPVLGNRSTGAPADSSSASLSAPKDERQETIKLRILSPSSTSPKSPADSPTKKHQEPPVSPSVPRMMQRPGALDFEEVESTTSTMAVPPKLTQSVSRTSQLAQDSSEKANRMAVDPVLQSVSKKRFPSGGPDDDQGGIDAVNLPASKKRKLVAPSKQVEAEVEALLTSITESVNAQRASNGEIPLSLENDEKPLEVYSRRSQLVSIQRVAPRIGERILVDLEISNTEWAKLSAWATRDHRSPLQTNLLSCFSIGCCTLRQFQEIRWSMPLDLSSLASVCKASYGWPPPNQIYLANMETEASPASSIILASPWMTQDGLVDLSHMMHEGLNRIRIQHRIDKGVYVLFLLYHTPSPAQLEALNKEREAELDWTRWTENLSKGFKFTMSLDRPTVTS